MWPSLLRIAKEGGADVVQTYVFWAGHEPEPRKYNFEGRYNLVEFIKLAAASSLLVHLRIGPYVCAEYNSGGFPFWLREVDGIEFRTDNAPFKAEMQRFVEYIMGLVKEASLLAWQGGPIILLQMENEYGNIQSEYGEAGRRYINWAARLAEAQDAGVPWVMCQQPDAPPNVIATCNGFYCDGRRARADQPAMWTEDWNGWYTMWGGCIPHRPVQDNAFAVAYFFATGGSYHNYYMYHGGTNFARDAGGPFITTSYDYDAPIDEYGQPREPKYSHLKALHDIIHESAATMLSRPVRHLAIGPSSETFVYGRPRPLGEVEATPRRGSPCVAFLVNNDTARASRVPFNGGSYELEPRSVTVLRGCREIAYSSAVVRGEHAPRTFQPIFRGPQRNSTVAGELADGSRTRQGGAWRRDRQALLGTGSTHTRRTTFQRTEEEPSLTEARLQRRLARLSAGGVAVAGKGTATWSRSQEPEASTEVAASGRRRTSGERQVSAPGGAGELRWSWTAEPLGNGQGESLVFPTPVEHLSLTRDATDYVWYKTGLMLGPEPFAAPGNWSGEAELVLSHAKDAVHIFLDEELAGSSLGPVVRQPIMFRPGHCTRILVLSMKVGLQHYGARLEQERAGLLGPVLVKGVPGTGDMDITRNSWQHQVGLIGESKRLFSEEGARVAAWTTGLNAAVGRPLTWLRAEFAAPPGGGPLAVDLGSMGKGVLWLNGWNLGRYWPSLGPQSGSCCSYSCAAGVYSAEQCATGCGEPTQRYYHLPREYVREGGNVMVLFEEMGGDPIDVSIGRHVPSYLGRS